MLVRALLLISRFGIQKKLLESGKPEEFTKFQTFFSVRNSILLYFISVFLTGVMFLGVTLSYDDYKEYYAAKSVPIYLCPPRSLTHVIIGLHVVTDVAFIAAAIAIRKQRVRETLGFKIELYLNAAVQIILPAFLYSGGGLKDIGWFLNFVHSFQVKFSNFINIMVMPLMTIQFTIMTVLPLWWCYQNSPSRYSVDTSGTYFPS